MWQGFPGSGKDRLLREGSRLRGEFVSGEPGETPSGAPGPSGEAVWHGVAFPTGPTDRLLTALKGPFLVARGFSA